MSEKIKISTVTISINEETDKIYVLFLAGKDNEFILTELYNKSFNKNIGLELGALTQNLSKEIGKLKNIVIDLTKSTLDAGQIVEYFEFDNKSYLAISLKFSELEKFIRFNPNFLNCYDKSKVVFIFFIPTTQIESEIVKKAVEKYFMDRKLGIIDLVKFIGFKPFIILLLLPVLINHLVPAGFLLEAIKSVGIPVNPALIKKN